MRLLKNNIHCLTVNNVGEGGVNGACLDELLTIWCCLVGLEFLEKARNNGREEMEQW